MVRYFSWGGWISYPSLNPRWAAVETAMTTPWPRPWRGCIKPSRSIAGALGNPGSPWNWPPCNGWTGSTTFDSSNPSGISHRPRLRQTIGGNSPKRPRPPTQLKPNSLLNSRGGSTRGSLWSLKLGGLCFNWGQVCVMSMVHCNARQ